MRLAGWLFPLALSCATSPATAQSASSDSALTADPRAVQPERPTVATHAHTVATGYLEFETGAEGDRYDAGRRAYSAPVVAKIGVSSHVQLNLGTTVYARALDIGQERGVGDATVGIKWRVLDDHPLLGDFALLPTLKLPTGSAERGTGSGTTDVGIILISSRDLHGVSLDLNAAYTRIGAVDSTPASKQALWTVSFGVPVAGRLSWVAELFGAPTIDGSGARSSVEFLTGPTFLVSTAFNIDLGVIVPMRGDRPNAVYAGVVWNVGRMPGYRR